MKKPKFYTEIAYILGIVFLPLGTSLMEKADLGLSMVIAPAYLIHLKLSPYFSFITFGAASYIFQALVLVLLSVILKKFKISYLFSFVTAVIYGFVLDGYIALTSGLTVDTLPMRIVFFVVGLVTAAFGIAMFFNTYFSPEAYDVFVKDIAQKKNLSFGKVKTAYDMTSLVLSVILSFSFFGWLHFEGIHIGTFVTACVNGTLIGFFSNFLKKHFELTDALPFRKFFER